MIIGTETLDELKAVLNFKKSDVEIDSAVLPVQSLSAIEAYMESLEPESSKEATKHMFTS